ncbi:MAG: SDR family oxidoreductase [Deltaproteobacteria bacterium]|nr:SDR family oxidoreductase [Deltaproteobacteria bacterium]
MQLSGRVALVTGGGRGIGRAIAVRLAEAGARVIITGRTAAELDATAAAIGATAVIADLASRAGGDALVEQVRAIARVDILVNNAGIAESASLERTDDAMWDRIMELNATAPFRLTRAFTPAMVAAGWGRIVNISSNAGVSGYGYTAAYCASKHALVGATRALAIDLARTGVTINAVCPGWVATRMVDEAAARIAAKTARSEDDAKAALAAMTPQRRLIEPEEVAHTVAMLCDHQARGIHGQTIVIDGGQVLK